MEKYISCRTCLCVTEKEKCTLATEMCYLDKTIKDIIIHLVPQMASTISENDRICATCTRTLKSSIKFINKCLEVECALADGKKQLSELGNYFDQISEMLIQGVNHDHSYIRPEIKADAEEVCIQTFEVLYHEDDNSGEQNIELIPVKGNAQLTSELDDINNSSLPNIDLNELEVESVKGKLNRQYFVLDGTEDSSCTLPENEYASMNNLGKLIPEFFKSKPKRRRLYKEPGKPAPCKICGKMVQIYLMKNHLLHTHAKVRRFKCKFCELTFTLSNNRDRHERLHESDPENKFRCDICWKKLKTQEEVDTHIKVHDKRPPKHACELCGERFHRKYLLDNHQSMVHTDFETIKKLEREIVNENLLVYQVS